ncbi:MAG TPA: copper resistance CopC family protein [Stellaceae bacterium]|nr:copper resistance CopC family protein [Stellaceae bacterium]
MKKFLFAIAAIALVPLCASGHAFMVSAVPLVGSTIQTAPREVSITYTQEVEPSFSKIDVQDAQGNVVDAGDTHSSPADAHILTVSLKPLPPGEYEVTWHVTSVDTHKTQGSFSFTVAP